MHDHKAELRRDAWIYMGRENRIDFMVDCRRGEGNMRDQVGDDGEEVY